jgi:hypothetical protein
MFHSYTPILAAYVVALAITCVLMLLLGPYRYPQDHPASPKGMEQRIAA